MRGKAHPLISCLSSMKKGAKLAPGLFFTKVQVLGEGHKIFENSSQMAFFRSYNIVFSPHTLSLQCRGHNMEHKNSRSYVSFVDADYSRALSCFLCYREVIYIKWEQPTFRSKMTSNYVFVPIVIGFFWSSSFYLSKLSTMYKVMSQPSNASFLCIYFLHKLD